MAVYIAICAGIGEGFKKLEPARKVIDSIAVLLGRAKDAEDSLRLPSPREMKRIEPPRKQPEAPSMDDEMPFELLTDLMLGREQQHPFPFA